MIILGINDYQTNAAEEGRMIPAYAPEDLPGAIEEAMKRQKGKGKRKGGRRKKIRCWSWWRRRLRSLREQ
jgi:hypothetical protein